MEPIQAQSGTGVRGVCEQDSQVSPDLLFLPIMLVLTVSDNEISPGNDSKRPRVWLNMMISSLGACGC